MPSKTFADVNVRFVAFAPDKHFERTSLSSQPGAQVDIMKTPVATYFSVDILLQI